MNPFLMKNIRPHYIDLQAYISAGTEAKKSESRIFLNANENPFELPGLQKFNRYPEQQPQKLLEGYAQLYGVKPDNVVMTRGADEAIVLLTRIFVEPRQDKILIAPPTFGIYIVNAQAMPAAHVIKVPLLKKNGTFELDTDGIIAAAKKDKPKLVYLCSPNNPTATPFSHTEILKIIHALKDTSIVILDETYAEFSKQGSLTGELPNHANLIILRTLSKSYALAGQRMGCFLSGDEDFIRFVRSKCLDIYPIPLGPLNAALHVMDPLIQKIARENIRKLLAEKDYLAEGFSKSPLVRHIFPSDANFFLAEMTDAAGFYKYCWDNDIILRDFSTKKLTENCIRISTGTREQNDKLLKLLEQYAAKKAA
ncbi:MAG: aminotransferase class I/II-fold pyridoxal phosphate-dependent enzyme [Alphaproteobacteria bacterium]